MQPQNAAEPVGRDGEDVAALLTDLVDHLDAMVAYWDLDQRCRFANQAYKDWFGRGRDEMLGVSLKELLGQDYEMILPQIEAAYRGERQVFERAVPRPDGSGVRPSLATYIPRTLNGQVVGMYVHMADVEPLKRLELELKTARDEAVNLARHDFLTGLPNRRLLEERIADVISRARRTQEKVYVMSVDVDHFKSINDLHGHAVGDSLLIEIAARIKSCVRPYDTVARLGGDEFFLINTGVPLEEEIESLAERLLQVARQPYSVGQMVLVPQLSIGIAEFPRHGTTKDELMLASDEALYAAKNAGRNCFRIAARAS
jgi:diguanylate cyclase (GGDEF)-like protein/PAS domain S-box-containing protein